MLQASIAKLQIKREKGSEFRISKFEGGTSEPRPGFPLQQLDANIHRYINNQYLSESRDESPLKGDDEDLFPFFCFVYFFSPTKLIAG